MRRSNRRNSYYGHRVVGNRTGTRNGRSDRSRNSSSTTTLASSTANTTLISFSSRLNERQLIDAVGSSSSPPPPPLSVIRASNVIDDNDDDDSMSIGGNVVEQVFYPSFLLNNPNPNHVPITGFPRGENLVNNREALVRPAQFQVHAAGQPLSPVPFLDPDPDPQYRAIIDAEAELARQRHLSGQLFSPQELMILDYQTILHYFEMPMILSAFEQYNVENERGITEEEVMRHIQLEVIEVVGEVTPDNTEVCVICLDELVPGKTAGRIDCDHRFHVGCITKWLGVKNSCPLCKRRGLLVV